MEAAAEYVSIDDLKPAPDNPRINDHVVEKVAKSIEKYGFAAPIVAQLDGTILAGHTRWKASKLLGLETIPCRYIDLSGDKAKLYRMADNKLGELADWDMEILAEQLEELSRNYQLELNNMGFDYDQHELEYDYNILDNTELEDEYNDLQRNTKRGIVIDFTPENYDVGSDLCKYFRQKNIDIGTLLIQKLTDEKANHE